MAVVQVGGWPEPVAAGLDSPALEQARVRRSEQVGAGSSAGHGVAGHVQPDRVLGVGVADGSNSF